jgi:hypothetical protein
LDSDLSEKVGEVKIGLEDWMKMENAVITQMQRFEDAKTQ